MWWSKLCYEQFYHVESNFFFFYYRACLELLEVFLPNKVASDVVYTVMHTNLTNSIFPSRLFCHLIVAISS